MEELLQNFAAEVDRKPLVSEYCGIMQQALNAVTPDLFADNPGEIALRLVGSELSSEAQPQVKEAWPDEVIDVVLVNAVDFVIQAAEVLELTSGSRPCVQQVCDTLVPVLQRLDEPLRHVGPGGLPEFKAFVRRARSGRPKVGDIISIPVGKTEYRFAIVVARNRFGMALGLFEGRGPLGRRPAPKNATLIDLLPAGSHPPIKSRPIYTAEAEIKSGRWRIVGHDKTLLDLFSRNPEIYHEADPDLPEVGPFGAGETADESLRLLSEVEAGEVGLLDGRYTQTRLPSEIEAMQEDGGCPDARR